MATKQTIINSLTPVIVILFLFTSVVLLINSKADKPKLKTLSLPEEFMEITKGDTLGVYESNDTVYLEFYRGDIRSNSKYKLLIAN